MRPVLLLLSLAVFVVAQEAGKAVVPTVSLEDQFERLNDLKAYRGSVVALIYGDRESAQANQQLGELIHTRFHPTAKGKSPTEARRQPVIPVSGAAKDAKHPEVYAIPVACIGKVPNLVAKVIRNQIRKGSPEVPVWLDFGETMKSQFPFKPGVPNVVVIDAQGRYRFAAAGQPTTEGTERLLGIIEALRKEALDGK
ncbi:MAG: hypothetical protein SNJ82_05100 [Gemmataceae bacterium]